MACHETMNSTNELPPASGDYTTATHHPDAPLPAQPVRKKRRWWFRVLVALGGLVVLAIVGVVLLAGYWQSLVRNYTATRPEPLPQVANFSESIENLRARWNVFWEAVLDGEAGTPFKLSADDLNTVIANIPELKDRLHLLITNNLILGRFSTPLGQAKQKELRGRFINGTARLNLAFDDGWLTAHVLDLKANGKPVPGWIQKKVQKEDILRDLNKNFEVAAFLHKLRNVEVMDGGVVLTP